MPAQGHLYIGERIRSYAEAVTIAERLGWQITEEELEEGFSNARFFERMVAARGQTFSVRLEVHRDYDEPFPVSDSHTKYTAALLGFNLTSRYQGSILDAGEENGQPEPFEVDLDLAQEVLIQVRSWWSTAHVLIMTEYH